jgi:hypothetical protein
MTQEESNAGTQQVVYTMDEDLKPAHFLAVVDNREELEEKIKQWSRAFESGEKVKPDNYNGISHRIVADFDRWDSGDADA